MIGRQKLWTMLTKAFRKQGKLDKGQHLIGHRSLSYYGVDDLDLVEITMLMEEQIGKFNYFEDESVARCESVNQLIEYFYQSQK